MTEKRVSIEDTKRRLLARLTAELEEDTTGEAEGRDDGR